MSPSTRAAGWGAEAGPPLTSDRKVLRGRIEELGRELPASAAGEALLALVDDPSRSAEQLRDALSTALMEQYRIHQSRNCFGLLYELNRTGLLQQVAARLRRYQSKADANDVLQEVFFNVYRYPYRFDCRREDAFRVWSATIVRNTVLKHLRSLSRSGRAEVPFEDLSEHPHENAIGPLGNVVEREAESECYRVYLTYLHLYLRFYGMLSERERRAIHLVEVEECSYREAAAELGIKLENLKMVIFRARRKIHRAMRRVFDGLPPDCRPARDPRATEGDLALPLSSSGGESPRARMARRAVHPSLHSSGAGRNPSSVSDRDVTTMQPESYSKVAAPDTSTGPSES